MAEKAEVYELAKLKNARKHLRKAIDGMDEVCDWLSEWEGGELTEVSKSARDLAQKIDGCLKLLEKDIIELRGE